MNLSCNQPALFFCITGEANPKWHQRSFSSDWRDSQELHWSCRVHSVTENLAATAVVRTAWVGDEVHCDAGDGDRYQHLHVLWTLEVQLAVKPEIVAGSGWMSNQGKTTDASYVINQHEMPWFTASGKTNAVLQERLFVEFDATLVKYWLLIRQKTICYSKSTSSSSTWFVKFYSYINSFHWVNQFIRYSIVS